MMDVLLALDRMLVEVSMRLYNLPRHEQLAMRKQNRHLHHTVRQHLPRLLKRLLADHRSSPRFLHSPVVVPFGVYTTLSS